MMLKFLLDRLKEPSTYAGLSGLALALGLNSEGWEVLSTALAGIFGAIAFFIQERRNSD